MHGPPIFHSNSSHTRTHTQRTCKSLVASLALWISVFATVRYGYYGSTHLAMGPSSSRLVKASPWFVKQVRVRDHTRNGAFLYGFSNKPELTSTKNWTVSDAFVVRSYDRRGFHLWLNKGSGIRFTWKTKVTATTTAMDSLQDFLLKGEESEQVLPAHISSSNTGIREMEYEIDEDDKYRVGIINFGIKDMAVEMKLHITAKIYDTTKAKSMCSTLNGSCGLHLLFPRIQFVVLATPNKGNITGSYIELTFVARIITYVMILGFVVIFIYLLLKWLGRYGGGRRVEHNATISTSEESETEALVPDKGIKLTYGTVQESEESGAYGSNSSDDLYDGKICVICYEEQRNCFFVPCGHCATCLECAHKILEEGESKLCPICRRLIHKVRKLFVP